MKFIGLSWWLLLLLILSGCAMVEEKLDFLQCHRGESMFDMVCSGDAGHRDTPVPDTTSFPLMTCTLVTTGPKAGNLLCPLQVEEVGP